MPKHAIKLEVVLLNIKRDQLSEMNQKVMKMRKRVHMLRA
jgi:hypothetical protein